MSFFLSTLSSPIIFSLYLASFASCFLDFWFLMDGLFRSIFVCLCLSSAFCWFISEQRASERVFLFIFHLNSSIQKNKKAKQSKRWFSLVWSGLVFGVLTDIGYWIGFANVNLFISNSFVYFGLISWNWLRHTTILVYLIWMSDSMFNGLS